jgi:hypothetical protein
MDRGRVETSVPSGVVLHRSPEPIRVDPSPGVDVEDPLSGEISAALEWEIVGLAQRRSTRWSRSIPPESIDRFYCSIPFAYTNRGTMKFQYMW